MAYDSTDFVVTAVPAPVRDPKSITDPRERVAYLRDFLRALPPERFDMGNFSAGSGGENCSAARVRDDCGTTACIAGWCSAIFTDDKKISGSYEATLLMGLSDDDASRLFYANALNPGDQTYWNATPAQAANVLDHYLATGEISWAVA